MNAPPLMACAAALALAGCATLEEAPPLSVSCRHEPGQAFVGQRATAEVGAAVLKATRAKALRWGPPGSAMTADFRGDRVTIAYDNNLTILRVDCG